MKSWEPGADRALEKFDNPSIESNLIALRERIHTACDLCGRPHEAVNLIAVSKTKPAEAVRRAYQLGLRHFGENYLAEALEKIVATEDLQAVWHFIGRIQSNKTRQLAEHFHWIHTIDREKIAQRLNDQCPPGKQLQCLLQVNIDNDPDKAGVTPDALEALLSQVCRLPNLIPRGLMTILTHPDQATAEAQTSYQAVADLAERVRPLITKLLPPERQQWDTLSMGMTGDVEQAIAAGATQVRIGTALFGARA